MNAYSRINNLDIYIISLSLYLKIQVNFDLAYYRIFYCTMLSKFYSILNQIAENLFQPGFIILNEIMLVV